MWVFSTEQTFYSVGRKYKTKKEPWVHVLPIYERDETLDFSGIRAEVNMAIHWVHIFLHMILVPFMFTESDFKTSVP